MSSRKYSVEQVKHDLELDEDLDLHERGWLIQKFGWVMVLGIVLTAALGLFGNGVLSSKHEKSGSVMLEYERFNRYEHEMELLVQSSGESITTIALPQAYMKDMRLVRVVPEPESNEAIGDNVTFNFIGTHNIVSIYVRPEQTGTINALVAVNDDARFNISHFIYP